MPNRPPTHQPTQKKNHPGSVPLFAPLRSAPIDHLRGGCRQDPALRPPLPGGRRRLRPLPHLPGEGEELRAVAQPGREDPQEPAGQVQEGSVSRVGHATPFVDVVDVVDVDVDVDVVVVVAVDVASIAVVFSRIRRSLRDLT